MGRRKIKDIRKNIGSFQKRNNSCGTLYRLWSYFFSLLSKSSFTLEDQKNLSYKAMELKEKKIQCIISNHDTIITRNLYKEAKIFKLKVQRNIASRASSRKKIDELVALF